MKLKLSACILIYLLVFSINTIIANDTIGVLAFQNSQQTLFPTAGETASDSVTMFLMKKGEYTLIERSRLDALLSEQSLNASGVVNASQATELGKVAGCKYIVIGTISELRMTKGMEKGPRTACVVTGCILGGLPGMLIAMIVPVKGYIAGISLKIVESETGTIKYIGTGTGNDNTLELAFNKAARKALAKLK